MNNKIYKNSILVLIIVFLSITDIYAQTRISSPYSRYGIGDISNSMSVRNMSMGGIKYAFRSPYSVNFSNPASYTGFDSLSFVHEIGIISNMNNLQTSELSQKSNYTNLGYILFGFPVTKKWKSSFGLLPFSNVGYKILSHETDTLIGNIDYLYEGEGGINQFYLGNAFQLHKKLSIGFNISYLFGSLVNTQTIKYPNSVNTFNFRQKKSVIPSDIYFNYGFQFEHKFKDSDKYLPNDTNITFCKKIRNKIQKGLIVDIGLVFNSSTVIDAKNDILSITYNSDNIIKDTIINVSGKKGIIRLPASIGAGIIFRKEEKWLIGADYQFQRWSDFLNSLGNNNYMVNSMQFCTGTEFTPRQNSTSSYLSKIHYRAGYRYSKTYLQFGDNQLNEFGISCGIDIPLKRAKSGDKKTINLSFEYGKRGTTANNLILEQFCKISVGFGMYERWFIKRKYE